jgi:protein-arginine kinase activator protein McsA
MPGIGEKFTKFASGTKKQAQVLVETSKLNSAIHKEEAAIQAAYSQIGKSYFDTYRDDADIPANFREMLDGILGRMNEIENLKAKITQIKGLKTCPACGAEAESETLFCSKCGHRFEEEAPALPPPATAALSPPIPAQVTTPDYGRRVPAHTQR